MMTDKTTIRPWLAYDYEKDVSGQTPKFELEVTDQTEEQGQMYIDVAPESDLLELFSIIIEASSPMVNRNDVNVLVEDAAPCVHIGDADSVLLSAYKWGKRTMIRLAPGVRLEQEVLDDGSEVLIVVED